MTDKAAPIAVTTRGAAGSYQVLVGCGLLGSLAVLLKEHAPAHRYALVSDSNVASLYGESTILRLKDAGLNAELFTYQAGEQNKNRAVWSDLTDRLLHAGHAAVDRHPRRGAAVEVDRPFRLGVSPAVVVPGLQSPRAVEI